MTYSVQLLDDIVGEIKKNEQYGDFLPNAFASMQYQGHTITWPWAIDIRIPLSCRILRDHYAVEYYDSSNITGTKVATQKSNESARRSQRDGR